MADRLVLEVVDDQLAMLVGELTAARTRGAERFTFTYDRTFAVHPKGYDLGPDLPRTSFAPAFSDRLFGAFTDTAPDRWGRTLVARSLERTPTEAEYLLAVHDPLRQGALRLRQGGEWQAPVGDIPRVSDLPTLRALAKQTQQLDDPHARSAAAHLLDMGTGSLGGAHPKVSVVDEAGRLCLAKLSTTAEHAATLRNEYAALRVAAAVGIEAPSPELLGEGPNTTLIVPRFDRTETGGRIGFASAMTLLGRRDGDRADYLDLAGQLVEAGAPAEDQRSLWNRIALGVALNNTDDHLRNHAVIRAGDRWRLSPIFDVNPNPDRAERHATSLDRENSTAGMAKGLLEAGELMGVPSREGRAFVKQVYAAVAEEPAFTPRVRAALNEVRQEVTAAMGRPSGIDLAGGPVVGKASARTSQPAATPEARLRSTAAAQRPSNEVERS